MTNITVVLNEERRESQVTDLGEGTQWGMEMGHYPEKQRVP